MNKVLKVCLKYGELSKAQVIEEGTEVGFIHKCRQCKIEYSKEYRKKNIDRIREYDRIRGIERRKNAKYVDMNRNSAREWRRRNADKVNDKVRKERALNPLKYRNYDKKWRTENLEKSRILDAVQKKNISYEEYLLMLKNQKGKCAICKKEETKKSRTRGQVCRLAIDHNHDSGKVRALLCHGCNTGIGKFKEDIDLLLKAIKYLKKHAE